MGRGGGEDERENRVLLGSVLRENGVFCRENFAPGSRTRIATRVLSHHMTTMNY